VSARARVGLAAVAALVVAAPIAAAWLVHRELPEARAAEAPFVRLLADSAAGDSAAFATLPEALHALFSLHRVIGTPAAESLPLYECIQMPGRRDDETRRRMQLRFPDSSAAVLFAITDRARGTLKRVEFVRRTPRAGQRAFIWDGVRDRTTSIWWFEGPRGLTRREERGDVPRGGPVPRAVRGLGRQLFVAPCADSAANSPMNPISGSRD
jgi:hypothetical protein